MREFSMPTPTGAKFITEDGACLSLAWFSDRYEIAYNLGGDVLHGWSDRIWEGGIHEGKGAFVALKRYVGRGGDLENVADVRWTGTEWLVRDFDDESYWEAAR